MKQNQFPRPSVAILLSTYNGELYIEEQLVSLLDQKYTNYMLYIRDDGSSDNTVAIIEKFVSSSSKITLYKGENIGCQRSFFELLCLARADIYMFCDQDDWWFPTKVLDAVEAIVEQGIQSPLLYHTDLVIVDSNLKLLHKSFMQHQGISIPEAYSLKVLGVQNCVVGCTMAFTDSLAFYVRRCSTSFGSIAMHDWWIALIARSFGKIIYCSEPTIFYRQHCNNVSGANDKSVYSRLKLQFSTLGIDKINNYRLKISKQANSFSEFYKADLSDTDLKNLKLVANFNPNYGFFRALKSFLLGARFQNSYMNISLIYTSFITSLFKLNKRII